MDVINFRVSPIGDSLELWVEVPNGPNYTNVKIDKIAISDSQHYTVGYPTAPQLELTLNNPVDDFKIVDQKKVVKILKFKDLANFSITNTGLFFAYIHSDVSGLPDPDTPCCCLKNPTVAVAANLYPLYNLALKNMATYNDSCEGTASRDMLIDIYLKKQMILTGIEMEDYEQVINVWDTLMFNDIVSGDCLNSCSHSGYHSTPRPIIGGCSTCS